MAEIQAEYKSYRNDFGRSIQILRFNNGDLNQTASRTNWINEDEALDYLNNDFQFANGKKYRIKYLVSKGWRSGQAFVKGNNTNLANHVFSHEVDIAMYGNQGLDKDEIHIFGIEVSEVKPDENLDWNEIFNNG